MRFLVDECTGPKVAEWLRTEGHDVLSVYDEARGVDDEEIARRAFAEDRILITNDKDFGEHLFRDKKPIKGIVLLRLSDERAQVKIAVLRDLLKRYANRLSAEFTVVSERSVRFARTPPR